MMFKKITHTVLATVGIFSLMTLVTAGLSFQPAYADTKKQVQEAVKDIDSDPNSNKGTKVTDVIRNVIGILSFLVGMIAVLMIVIAGFRFVTSNGDAGTVSSAKNTIIYAVIGIIITVMAYAIVNFILTNID